MRLTHLFFLLFLLFHLGCKTHLTKIEAKQINISQSISTNSEIEDFIKPYRTHIERDLDSTLSYAPKTYTKNDNELNTAIGNLMAEIVYAQGNPIFKKRTNNNIDIVLLNHGGIRAPIPKGPISTRTAYEVMPFENKMVVVALRGETLNEMVSYLVSSKNAHPFLGLKITLDQEYKLQNVAVNGKPIEQNKVYHIATSNYLYNGGDNMNFFKSNEGVVDLDYKIRNAMIDYFKRTDTIKPVKDDRFIRK
ncbi:5'-nucleotidase C-terminal domain-containing protein [Seonamhaeicola sp. ML3]|uniref:5'-nucleotidase C-terminal domain-containing protein n=1 Tax=Seonamhaeicola sp. ML3 TaxID=2937786 RepID=UPI00200F70E9|nr:5'-nucleotidase [Seonamhaeicola sp. ML3]